MAYQRKQWLGILAIGVAITAMPSVARADMVLIDATPAASFVDLEAQGFGAAPRMLVETGNVTPQPQCRLSDFGVTADIVIERKSYALQNVLINLRRPSAPPSIDDFFPCPPPVFAK